MQTGNIVDAQDTAVLTANAWGRVRVQGRNYDDVMLWCQAHQLVPVWVLWPDQVHEVPCGSDVELYNEPDCGCAGTPPWPKLSPAQYREDLLAAYPTLQARGCTIYAGSVTNISPPALSWLTQMLVGVPGDVGVATHRYSDGGTKSATTPRRPYATRSAEFAALKAAIGSRRWAVTEFGYHTARQSRYGGWLGKWLGFRLTDQQVVENVRLDLLYYKAAGADFAVAYQWLDGPNDEPLHRYGARRLDGTYKPWVEVPRRW
jgi:hypothetical protein